MVIKKFLVIAAIAFGFFLIPGVTLAQPQPLLSGDAVNRVEQQDQAFLETAGLQSVSLGQVVAVVIRALLSFLGILFVVLIIYAGFLWMTSAGSEDKIGTAKGIMISAIIGLTIVLSAYAITIFVLDKILGATGSGGGGSSAITS